MTRLPHPAGGVTMLRFGRSPLLALALFAGASPLAAQQADLSALASGLGWREIGPAITGGRISDLAVDESNPARFYVGTATGGLWKTTSAGMSWEPVFDDQPTSSIGAVALAPSNPNVVWVGTGEPQNRQSSPYGAGVFRSLDGGRTWEAKGLVETRHVGAIVVHPRDPDVVYVAAVGHLWGPNPERGVYRTTDGGETWEKVLYVDEDTGAIDLVMDPGDPRTLFAATYQRRRTGFGFSADGPGSGIHRTLDGGDTWTELTEGLPDGDKGRIGLDVYRRDGNLVYAIVEGKDERARGIYRSRDRGDTWERVSGTNPRPMYFSMIRIDPNDPERIYIGGVQLGISDDGGKTFRPGDGAEGIHVDHHALWIDPSDSDHVLLGSDGGVSVTYDRAEHWREIDNLPIGQFYEIGVSGEDPYLVCGGLQDNSSWCAPIDTRTEYGIQNRDWIDVSGGDGFYNKIDPSDPNLIFTESQGGNISRFDRRTGESVRIRPVARPTAEDEDRAYRFNWNAPIHVSTHGSGTVYIGANHLLRSRDRGTTWEEASPDLTKQIDRDTLPIMGRPTTESTLSRYDGISSYGNITTIGESPLNAQVLYVGTDDGNVQGTRDGGATWTDLTSNLRGVPARTYVSSVVPSAAVEGRVYVTFDGHRNDDLSPYVFVSEDHGRTWRSIVSGLPDESVNRLREHPRTPELLFVGNEIGLWFSLDRGGSWHRLDGELPTVPVDDIVIHPRTNDLLLGTHGRSIWVLEDVGPLETLAQATSEPVHLFPVRTATIQNRRGGWPFWGDEFQGGNPPDGALVRYRLAAAPDSGAEAELTILDASGDVVRTLEAEPTAGLHEVVWDLRLEPPYAPERGQSGGGGGGGFGGPPQGPRVLPGTYTARLTVGERTSEQRFDVRLDPHVQVARADLEARQEALLQVHALAGPIYEAGRRVRDLLEQVGNAQDLLEDREDVPADLTQEADSLAATLDGLQDDLRDVQRALNLRGALEGASARPTADQLWQIEQAWTDGTSAIERLNTVVQTRMPAFNARLDREGVRPDPGEPVPLPRRP
ncbi:MAG: glycosyl hydrolase [Gemmatimonadota bacterium]